MVLISSLFEFLYVAIEEIVLGMPLKLSNKLVLEGKCSVKRSFKLNQWTHLSVLGQFSYSGASLLNLSFTLFQLPYFAFHADTFSRIADMCVRFCWFLVFELGRIILRPLLNCTFLAVSTGSGLDSGFGLFKVDSLHVLRPFGGNA